MCGNALGMGAGVGSERKVCTQKTLSNFGLCAGKKVISGPISTNLDTLQRELPESVEIAKIN